MTDQLDPVRRTTLDALVEHLAEEHLDVDEFERRVALVKDAREPAAVRDALAGLPGRGASQALP